MTAKNHSIDTKIIKRHYPKLNIDDKLIFTLEADPNLCLVKNKIAIHFSVELHEDYIPDNGFAAKKFSVCSVELNSQRVSANKSKLVKSKLCKNNYSIILFLEQNTFSMIGWLKLEISILISSTLFIVRKDTLISMFSKIIQIMTKNLLLRIVENMLYKVEINLFTNLL